MQIIRSKVSGPYSPLFWSMVFCCFIIPLPILAFKKLRTITGTLIASIGIVIGMWLERFLIIVPTLAAPRLTFNWGHYRPTSVEILITIATIPYFIFLYSLFPQLFPIFSAFEY